MPPRKKAASSAASKPAAKAGVAKKPGGAGFNGGKKKRAGPYKMPPPLPKGAILTDLRKNKWCLGSSVGKGGFGEIYTACPSGKSIDKAQYVIKIEPHENGPLFTELSFYTRIAKPERIDEWVKSHDLPYLAIPKFIASGSHEHDGTRFRFMVMERFGEDIGKKFIAAGRKFSLSTVCHLALRLLEALEFLHESEYVHADIKGSNLLTGYGSGHAHEVYLVDYGLAYRYCPDGEHKAYKEDPRKAHDGTIEFTSIDAHKGVSPSRRADLEILGYCLLQWACGELPWEGNLENKDQVAKMKIKYQGDASGLVKACFGGSSCPPCLKSYMEAVYKLDYTDTPNYGKLKELFTKQLKSLGCSSDGGESLDWISPKKAGQKRKTKEVAVVEESGSEEEEEVQPPPKKKRMTKAKAAAKKGKSPDEVEEAEPVAKAKPAAKKGKSPDEVEEAEPVAAVKKPRQKKQAPAKQRKEKKEDEADESKTPMVYYPKELGYQNGEGTSSSAPSEEEEEEEEEEEWQPSMQKKRKAPPRRAKKKVVSSDDDGSDEEYSPRKRRVGKPAAAKTRRTRAKKT